MDIQKTVTTATDCPVCGYPLENGPEEFSICPSCGTEFGYSDARRSHPELSGAWIADGAPWTGPAEMRPTGWSAVAQLEAAGLYEDAMRLRSRATAEPPAGIGAQ
jgi:hypothetical protein